MNYNSTVPCWERDSNCGGEPSPNTPSRHAGRSSVALGARTDRSHDGYSKPTAKNVARWAEEEDEGEEEESRRLKKSRTALLEDPGATGGGLRDETLMETLANLGLGQYQPTNPTSFFALSFLFPLFFIDKF
ncbi:hypothetical protein HK104_006658, partial [Borealophlyctis nickersoniae]